MQLFITLDCMMNENSLALKGVMNVTLTAFYRLAKALHFIQLQYLERSPISLSWFSCGSSTQVFEEEGKLEFSEKILGTRIENNPGHFGGRHHCAIPSLHLVSLLHNVHKGMHTTQQLKLHIIQIIILSN